jgi:hypothetical protein
MSSAVREEARKIIDNLPDEASWNDLMYEMYVRQKIDKAIDAAESGETISHEEVRKKFQKP